MLDLEIVWETAIATITMSSAYALRYGSLQKVAQVLGSSDISILDTHGYIKIVVYNVKLPRLILDEDAASAVDPC